MIYVTYFMSAPILFWLGCSAPDLISLSLSAFRLENCCQLGREGQIPDSDLEKQVCEMKDYEL
jgi:hypothetical protein